MRLTTRGLAATLLSASCAAFAATDPLSHANPLPAPLEKVVQDVTRDLTDRGYEVRRGYWDLFGTEQCKYAIQTLGNCLGNNPTAPYVRSALPRWRDEFVDQKLHLVFGPMRRGFSTTYRLGDREALVVLAQLPPRGDYLGLQTYVFTREGTLTREGPIWEMASRDPIVRDLIFAESPNPSRVIVFSTIGNSTNDVVIADGSGSAWDERRYFIVTPDAATEREITAALLRAGVPDPSHVFVEPVSPDLVRIGLGPSADDLMTILRYIPFDAAGEAWRERLPLTVLRVRDTNTSRATEPYPGPVYDERTAASELPLQRDLTSLIAAVKDLWHQPGALDRTFLAAVLPPPRGVDLVGQHCLERPTNCLGDTQDTDTYRISPSLTIDGGEVIAVVGTLATATGNARYVSLGVNRALVLEGVANVKDEDLDGTASDFAGVVSDASKFYVTYFARDCTGLANCHAITESEVPAGEPIKLMQRNYIRPGTARGARAEDLLSPSVVFLDGATRP